MGLLGWLGDKVDKHTLTSCEKTLMVIAERAEVDESYAAALRDGVHDLLKQLFPADFEDPLEHVVHTELMLDRVASGALDDMSNRIMNVANNMEKSGLTEAAAAAGVVAGWFKAAAVRERGSREIHAEASKLKNTYEFVLKGIFVKGSPVAETG